MGNAPTTIGPSTGLRCGRIEPAHAEARDGLYVWCIGADDPTYCDDVEVGDVAGVEQLVDLSTIATIAIAIQFRQSVLRRAAVLRSTAGSYPSGFAGGETLQATVDGGAPLTVTFQAADQTIAQVAARIALALGVTAGGDYTILKLTSPTVGSGSSLEIVGGSAAGALGFTVGDTDAGQEITFTFKAELLVGTEVRRALVLEPAEGETIDFETRTINVSDMYGDHVLRLTAEAVAP